MYGDIKLRLYLDIASTQEYRKLLIKGFASDDECFEAWEGILKSSSKITGDLTYTNYFSLTKSYALLVAKYNIVKACLLKVSMVVDRVTVQYLSTLGYQIDMSSTLAYATTIDNAIRNSNNLITKIATKQKQLEKYLDKQGETATIGKIVALTNAALNYRAIDVDVLLCEYNEYKEIIKKQNGRRRSDR